MIGIAVIHGIYRGLQDRFGSNVIEGYRQYKDECRFWATDFHTVDEPRPVRVPLYLRIEDLRDIS